MLIVAMYSYINLIAKVVAKINLSDRTEEKMDKSSQQWKIYTSGSHWY